MIGMRQISMTFDGVAAAVVEHFLLC